jgi:hypothetical protein
MPFVPASRPSSMNGAQELEYQHTRLDDAVKQYGDEETA